MYWIDNFYFNIQSANLDGSDVQEVVLQGTDINPANLAVDATNEKLYWIDTKNRKIQRGNLDGTNVEVLLTNISSPTGISLDPDNGKMYFLSRSNTTNMGSVTRTNLDGTNIELLIPDLLSPVGLTIDTTSAKIYWNGGGQKGLVNGQGPRIGMADLDGKNVEYIVTNDVTFSRSRLSRPCR